MGRLATFGKLTPGEALTKSELIAELAAANPHLRGQDVETIVATIFEEITFALARGERVELRGFGAFSVKIREARRVTIQKLGSLSASLKLISQYSEQVRR